MPLNVCVCVCVFKSHFLHALVNVRLVVEGLELLGQLAILVQPKQGVLAGGPCEGPFHLSPSPLSSSLPLSSLSLSHE